MAESWGDWYPTTELRWHPGRDVDSIPVRTLQQKWCRLRDWPRSVDSTPAEEEWRDVPTE